MAKARYILSDGSIYVPPDGGVGPKTIYNFLRRDGRDNLFTPSEPFEGVSLPTVRYLHVFLFASKPNTVLRWTAAGPDAPPAAIEKIPEISQFYHDYKTVEINEHLPIALKAIAPSQKGQYLSRESKKEYLDHILNGTKVSLYNYGIFLIIKTEHTDVSRFVYIDGRRWDVDFKQKSDFDPALNNAKFANAYRYEGWAWSFAPNKIHAIEDDGRVSLSVDRSKLIFFARCRNCFGHVKTISFEYEEENYIHIEKRFEENEIVFDYLLCSAKNTGHYGKKITIKDPNLMQMVEMEVLGLDKWGPQERTNYIISALWNEELERANSLCNNLRGYNE